MDSKKRRTYIEFLVDVFLTPLKPPTKASISIEAVQSSLYFLHLERPEDDALRKSLEVTKATESRKDEASPIQRKPLPATPFANYPASQRPPTPPKSYPYYQPPLPGSETATQAERYTARGANLRLATDENVKPALTSRKPVGARPMPARPNLEMPSETATCESSPSPSPIEHAQRQMKLMRKPVQPGFPAYGQEPESADTDQGSPTRPAAQFSSQLPLLSSDGDVTRSPKFDSLRVTLIRRDPTSGSQWNVGSINQHSGIAPLREVDLELTSPGYIQFAKLDTGSGGKFHRKVAYMLAPKEERSSITRRRSNSTESFSSPFSTNKKSRQAYAFLSPWQGICSFTNGLDGKSLRCRHSLPGANPSVPGINADVAELRFNLPWATLRLRDPNKKPGSELSEVSPNVPMVRPENSSNREQWRRSFQVLTHKARHQLSNSDGQGEMASFRHDPARSDRSTEDDRFSLDLGREKAGGGFKGHSAKLGKLIIHDEGLKMCDLVVAACMGVWWNHYAGDV